MQKIKLRNTSWEYDPSIMLGPPGGFGTVFLGHDDSGMEVAVKKLHISANAARNRELVISEDLEGKTLPHVIPFYDSGIDAETTGYFVVMAKAECSLQPQIDRGPTPENEAAIILSNIAQGLREADIFVHRDLKPGNVLYHENRWKLADFGIARFVEESTSLYTLKDCLSPLYAAPEQWRFERATKATDVYAFGCVAFALLTGNPPFACDDLRQCHLNEEPPPFSASPKMQQLVSLCLRKHPQARPSVDSIIKQLAGISENPMHVSPLAKAGAIIAAEEARKEAEISSKRSEEEERRELAKDAFSSLDTILDRLFGVIETEAPAAKRLTGREIGVELGAGKIRIERIFQDLKKEDFARSKKNIVCGALICLDQDAAHYRGRSANLWFGEVGSGEYRWSEVSYFYSPWGGGTKKQHEPFGISQLSELADADYAMANVTKTIHLAALFKIIDGEDTEDFVHRWASMLAHAVIKKLQRPLHLPES